MNRDDCLGIEPARTFPTPCVQFDIAATLLTRSFGSKEKTNVSTIALLKAAIKKLPIVKQIISERDKLHTELMGLKRNLRALPPGHFSSPIPDLDEVAKDEMQIFGHFPLDIPGIDLCMSAQRELVEQFVPYYKQIPFQPHKTAGLRYFFENDSYSYSDAIFLHCMIRFLKPKRLIEVGSGYSSCVTLDTNELFFNNSIATTFIEPYPELLMSLVKEEDHGTIRIIPSRLQDVDVAEFATLKSNDILFIDSTHVSKINSDVNRIFFDILPRLAPGVHVHLHDIMYPFEYPKEWIYKGWCWNEAYLLRTFLQFNGAFRVVLMNTFMEHFEEAFFRENMPLCLKNPGGSIWIRRE